MAASVVINVWANEPDFSPLEEPNPSVQKIIIGESPTNSSASVTPVATLPLFASDFTNLTHLFLWTTTGVKRVPALASKQQVLEIRKSEDLTTIDTLPRTLQTLVLEDCSELEHLPALDGREYSNLVELSLAGCPKIAAAWISQLIAHAPNLQRLDLSRCTQIALLPARLPAKLDRLVLNGCTGLWSLPDPLPLTLRRLELNGASNLGAQTGTQWTFPELPRSIDYVNLAHTTSLTRLPQFPKAERVKGEEPACKPRTLFLYGSAVLEPPASEHGATAETNVALETREYQDEVELVGRGKVSRCKLLLLGNGQAGKTMLALNLHPHFSKQKKENGGHYNGTTHGVQFWDWPNFEAATAHTNKNVNLHIWDFGGQEIYHSTHRIFVSRGSVFCVLWNPDQDGRKAPAEHGYQDVWYPVRYWLDYIHMECPHNRPLIAIVCSHQGTQWQPGNTTANDRLKQQLQTRLNHIIGDDYASRCPMFVLDSELDLGERAELETWLKQSVLTVVETQGTVVPKYWEIAQNMVEQWLPDPRRNRDGSDEANAPAGEVRTRITIDEFADELHAAIEQQLRIPDPGNEYDLLRRNYQDGAFLTDRRIQRTLRFLTHSGWLYWNSELFESRVIIDQAWALETVYAALNRSSDSAAYRKLTAARGRFTFENLRQWCWKGEALDENDQKLILSFMTSVGVCFELKHDYSSGETVYISPTHLPDSGSLAAEFASQHPDSTQETVSSTQLHQGHWFAILRELCKRYGHEGEYAKDACLIRGSTYRWNREDKSWWALLQFRLDDDSKGLGGRIFISVAGEKVAEKRPSLKRFVESFLPGFAGKASDAVNEFDRDYHGCVENAPTVFFSYAWDPVDKAGYYEEAVDAIYDALKPWADRGMVRLLRDKKSMAPGDYITRFIQNPGAENVDLVLLFSSDKYWESWFCMAELNAMIESFSDSTRNWKDSVLLVEHLSGLLHSDADQKRIEDYWMDEVNRRQFPAIFKQKFMDKKLMGERFVQLIRHDVPTITSNAVDLRRVWNKSDAEKIIAWVIQKLGLPSDGGQP